jgi:GT2 family glycosyltransferase
MESNKSLPRISIIINSYRDIYKLQSCIAAVKKSIYNNKEIIVVSYGISKNDIKETGISFYIDKLILLKKDLGLPAQRNIGFKAVDPSSKYVLFIDDDVILNELTLINLIRTIEDFPNIGLAQPLLITPDQLIDCAGAFIDILGYSYMPFHGEPISSLNTRANFFKVSYGAGACLLLRADIFRANEVFQPFDASFYFNYEDVDLSLRVWKKGFMVVCVPSATAVHNRRRTAKLKKSPAYLVYLNTRNKFITLASLSDIKTLPLFILFECIKAIYLLKINPAHTLAIFSAILWIFQNFKNIHIRRKILKEKINKNDALSTIILKPHFPTLIRNFRHHYDLK